jgi:hypothetical protein
MTASSDTGVNMASAWSVVPVHTAAPDVGGMIADVPGTGIGQLDTCGVPQGCGQAS